MRYLFALLPFISGALASPLPGEDTSAQPSWGFEIVTTTVPGSVGTVIATRTRWVSAEEASPTNEGTTATATSVVTSYSRQSQSTWATTPPSSESESEVTKASTTAKSTSTTTSDEPKPTEDKSSSTESEQPEATEFAPPANDKKNSAKVEQAAKDVQEAGVFALFESNAPIKFGVGPEEEKDIKDHFKWILLDEKVSDKEYHFTSTHIDETQSSDYEVTCTLKLHPAPAGRYAYLHALGYNPWYNYGDSDCIMEIKCDDWERDKADGCTAQPD
ncbi:hypothetical protein I204_08123 [Kwoniella mangroviensis CBS 8886]|uniref:uncharacterized protein n=1 Tax=Kwoniella mangroviensis CBS 8507 TaxID=1296122 RepID=UPI00080CDB77|nr:uncharacterized protein I203_04517 [Kwoniella mangroviensis CBS 8507]OCF66191.1 hypothetical protein I203_04517 [Kwoniella mangroviensis CBS 8507]OCF71170.1 hypothetical protein I204_08123 [Kwoniella mangroviensis CBS 8886]